MCYAHTTRFLRPSAPLLFVLAGLCAGCPVPTGGTYDEGYQDGFKLDDWYWDGFGDSFDTLDFTPMYYDASEILDPDSPEYDAGYWDGIWWAYNDGYFVSYRYAFIVGFSEGYDNAFWDDYLDFLATDEHTEYLNGGWTDGYNDGYSEGRVFGAYDYEAGWLFDWEDALYDYEVNLTDLYFEEVDVGTGEYGDVILYEHGVDPAAKSRTRDRAPLSASSRSIRAPKGNKAKADDPFRPLTAEFRHQLDIRPAESSRNHRELWLTTTWLDRISDYFGTAKSAPTHSRATSRRSPSETQVE